MKKKYPFLLLTFFIVFIGFSQDEAAITRTRKAFEGYFGLDRESVYLHLNKSAYVVGEEIWFKGYLYHRRKQLPFTATRNLYVGIYDSIGNQIDKRLYRCDGGYTQGSIALDSTYSGGEYYIKASTNWMRNFREDDSHVQKIMVYDGTTVEKGGIVKQETPDVQFLPEGGHLVSGIENNVGVRAVDGSGHGVRIAKGVIRDENGVALAQFHTGSLGLGSFRITPHHAKRYSASVTLRDGKVLEYRLPQAREEGVAVILKKINRDSIIVVLGANKATRAKIGRKRFHLWVHRDGLSKKLPVRFSDQGDYVSHILEKGSLHSGMNIITLLDHKGDPVLERLYFNHRGIEFSQVELWHTRSDSDSLAVSLRVVSDQKSVSNLSVSVLPSNTLAYNHRDNILSTFMLKPYVRGFVENPKYYFSELTPAKEHELDLLLITQGWSSYDWEAIYNDPPEAVHAFEQGLTLNGTLHQPLDKREKLLLYAVGENPDRILNLRQGEISFNIPDYFPYKGDRIRLSLLKKNGMAKPKLYLNLVSNLRSDRINDTWLTTGTEERKTIFGTDMQEFILPSNTIALDEVTLTEERKQKNIMVPQIFEHKLTKVTKEIAAQYPNVLDIIRINGYYVYINPNPVFDRVSIRLGRPVSSRGRPVPRIYIDDIIIADFERLLYLNTSAIASYYIDRTGNGEPGGGGGIIRFYTKEMGELDSSFVNINSPEYKIYEHVAERGYEKNKRFYTPKYRQNGEAFENFGVVHWSPKVVTGQSGVATFRVPETDLNEINLYVEGMASDGSLISTVKTINLSPSSH